MYLEANETAKIGPLLEPLLTGIHGSTGAVLIRRRYARWLWRCAPILLSSRTTKQPTPPGYCSTSGRTIARSTVAGRLRPLLAQAGGLRSPQPTRHSPRWQASWPAAKNSHWVSESFWARSIAIWVGASKPRGSSCAALEQADQEPARLSKQMLEVLTQVRLLMVDMLREQEDYRAASEEVDRLIQDNPRLLEPMIKKAQVLQGWSTLDPDKLDAATGQWIRVRSCAAIGASTPRMSITTPSTTRRNACFCWGAQTKDHAKIVDAEKILKATLITNQNLNGPDTVKRFHALLDKIKAALPPVK